MAICGVGSEWVLVESRRTKTLFLRKAIEELGLTQVTVLNERLETLVEDGQHLGAFDAFTSRAAMTLGPTLRLASAVVKPEGDAFLWKGSRREDEMAAEPFWRTAWQLDGLIGIGVAQTVVCRFKKGPTT